MLCYNFSDFLLQTHMVWFPTSFWIQPVPPIQIGKWSNLSILFNWVAQRHTGPRREHPQEPNHFETYPLRRSIRPKIGGIIMLLDINCLSSLGSAIFWNSRGDVFLGYIFYMRIPSDECWVSIQEISNKQDPLTHGAYVKTWVSIIALSIETYLVHLGPLGFGPSNNFWCLVSWF